VVKLQIFSSIAEINTAFPAPALPAPRHWHDFAQDSRLKRRER
jgi:hypothetical protein